MFVKPKLLLIFAADIVLIAASLAASFLLRFDLFIPEVYRALFIKSLIFCLIIKPPIFVLTQLYRPIWNYASVHEAVLVLKGVTIASIITIAAVMAFGEFKSVPRSIFILDWMLLFMMVLASRIQIRLVKRFLRAREKRGAGLEKALIIGAGEAGSLLLKKLKDTQDMAHEIIGFIDDDARKKGLKLHGVPVLGTTRQIRAIGKRYGVRTAIIAMPSASREAMRRIVSACEKADFRFKTMPDVKDIITGKVTFSHLKEVEIEDLLGRDPVRLNEEQIENYLTGKKILVTGAGGSIGSELCRQIARYSPSRLVLFDNGETALYHIEKELRSKYPEIPFVVKIGDMRSPTCVEAVYKENSPSVVFHAAAYKHVPMMECNPVEAAQNNIYGTKLLADAAAKFGAKNFVMISTDKAVNPTNVMGATKRAAERYVQALSRKSRTKFTTVRFGNVLGSNGSVLPLFKEQIRNGGPVTITHPEIIRYFMTIPEASQLVLQAGCMGNGGEIFLLDMGEPVRIVHLAEELIRLSGLEPYKDIEIAFTGLRPGEKLYEELLIHGENVKGTEFKKIKVLDSIEADLDHVSAEFREIFRCIENYNKNGVLISLKRLVPEYKQGAHEAAPVAEPREAVNFDVLPSTLVSTQ